MSRTLEARNRPVVSWGSVVRLSTTSIRLRRAFFWAFSIAAGTPGALP